MTARLPRRRSTVTALGLMLALVTACGTGAAPSGSPTGDGGTVTGISPELIAAAQSEGSVVLYAGGHQQQTLERLQQQMQELFGIRLTFNRDDSGAIANAVSAELVSGASSADVVSLTDPAVMDTWAQDGVIIDAAPSNRDDIIDGLDDPADPQVPYGVVPLGIMYNSASTDVETLPRTWAELAAAGPGTVVSADPNSSGTALAFYTMVDTLDGDFVTGLAGRRTIVTDSSLALAQLVLTGEADIGVPAIESAVIAAAAEGEPLAIAFMQDGVPTYTSQLGVLAAAPHPNAARLLVQYHLSPEFQADLAAQGGRPILEGAPQPRDAADLGGATLLSTTLEQVRGRGQQVAAEFARAFDR